MYLDCCVTRGSTALAQAIDDEQLADDDDDACEQEIKEPVLKVSAIMETLKFGWNAIFTPDSAKQGSLDVSQEVIETIIDRSRTISSSKDLSDQGNALLEGQQSTAMSFNIDQPLVSTRLLNGSVLDAETAEDHVQAIAASWNESRYLSRVAHAAPIFAACVTVSLDSRCSD